MMEDGSVKHNHAVKWRHAHRARFGDFINYSSAFPFPQSDSFASKNKPENERARVIFKDSEGNLNFPALKRHEDSLSSSLVLLVRPSNFQLPHSSQQPRFLHKALELIPGITMRSIQCACHLISHFRQISIRHR
jgi:hypothetical protein